MWISSSETPIARAFSRSTSTKSWGCVTLNEEKSAAIAGSCRPASDVAEGRVYSAPRSSDDLSRFPSLLRVHHGESAPADAYVAVRYRERWFWISDRDVESKSVLNALLLLFSLTEATSQAAAPLVTIPAR